MNAKQDFISKVDEYILAAMHVRDVEKSWTVDESLPKRGYYTRVKAEEHGETPSEWAHQPSPRDEEERDRRRTLHSLEMQRIDKRTKAIAAGHVLGGKVAAGIVAVLELPGDNLDRLVNAWVEAKKDLADLPPENKNTASPTTLAAILLGKDAILEALGQSDDEKWDYIRRLSKKTDGPINVKGGGKAMANRSRLLTWWAVQTDAFEVASNESEQPKIQTHGYGRDGEVAPEIGGVKKARKARKTS